MKDEENSELRFKIYNEVLEHEGWKIVNSRRTWK